MKTLLSVKNLWEDAKHELSQVTWLSRNQAVWISFITIVFVFSSAVVLWLIDVLFLYLYKLLQNI